MLCYIVFLLEDKKLSINDKQIESGVIEPYFILTQHIVVIDG